MKWIFLAIFAPKLLFAGAAIDSAGSAANLDPTTVNINGENDDCFSVINATGPIFTVNCTNGRIYVSTDSSERTTFGTQPHVLILATATTSNNLALRAISGQTGNLLRFEASNGAQVSFVNSGGAYVFNGTGVTLGGSTGQSGTTLVIDSNGSGNIPLWLYGRAGQTADLVRIGGVGATGQNLLHVITSNGNVGFFDQTPDALLEVKSSPTVSGTGYVVAVSSFDDTTGSLFSILGNGNIGIGDPTPDARFEILASTTGPSSAGTSYVLAVSSQNDTVGNIFAILGSGNVGIGTASPASPSAATTVFHIRSSTPSINLQNDSSTDWEIMAIDSAGGSSRGPNDFVIAQDGASRFSISDVTGNVGINQTSSEANLEIVSNQSGTGFVFDVSSQASSTEMFVITGDGNVGVGSSVPTANLHIVSRVTGNNFALHISSQDGTTTMFKVASTGNVGIGTGTPRASLDVVWDATGQGIGMPTRSTAQLGTTSANKVGMMVFNTTLNTICFSTSTSVGGWVRSDLDVVTACD